MVEYAALGWVVFPGDVDTCLLVQPPRRQAEILRDLADLLQHDSVGHEPGIDIARHPAGVASEGHGRTADDEHVRDDAAAGKALADGGECLLQFAPGRAGHRRGRSRGFQGGHHSWAGHGP